ncbi:MAG: class I tRNA ligase family protein, partial [Acidimicrobiales bacterium]
GTTVTTPLFGVDVLVVAHPLAQPEKGTGAAMVCTFGDTTDVVWWRELRLPMRTVIGRDGRLLAHAPAGFAAAAADLYQAELAGKTVRQAQAAIVALLGSSGELVGDLRPTRHPVKFYERGERPLEIVTSRQWWIRTLAHRAELLARGEQLRWHPPYMAGRYRSWVEGLNSDWLISRQRFFGVPFPVWYPLDASGAVDHDAPLVPTEDQLPVDPSTDVPSGFVEAQRGQPGGFVADPDVMDTWATSSLTPQIAGGWEEDPDLWSRVWPMDLRPQAHDIIRTWLFATVVRAHLEHDSLPWTDTALSGWILDPDRKKMAKSKGNALTPLDLLETHGTDAVRYWAASARLGTDTAFDEGQMKVGRRLATKLLNVSNFVLGPRGLGLAALTAAGSVASAAGDAVVEPVDRALLAGLDALVAEATAAFEGYDHARVLERTEAFFWTFCDDYVELVKARAYGELGDERAASARAALLASLSVLLRLFAPFLPYVTEEVWSWSHPSGSIHQAEWPGPSGVSGDPDVLRAVAEVLAAVRRAKTEAGRSLRVGVASLTVRTTAARALLVTAGADDLRAAGAVEALAVEAVDAGSDETVDVRLA